MKLILGVVDVGYSEAGKTTTTGDVAEHLENKYHIMRTFYELNEDFIGEALAEQAASMVENLAMGVDTSRDLTTDLRGRTISGNSFGGRIEERFRDFLDSGEMSRLLPASMQSAAAAAGVSHRKKSPYAQANRERTAFVDTGLYQASMRAWVA